MTIQQLDLDWYITAAHLETVITQLPAAGLSVSVTPVIEARDLLTSSCFETKNREHIRSE